MRPWEKNGCPMRMKKRRNRTTDTARPTMTCAAELIPKIDNRDWIVHTGTGLSCIRPSQFGDEINRGRRLLTFKRYLTTCTKIVASPVERTSRGISGYQKWICLVLTLEYIASSVNIRIIDVTPYSLRVSRQYQHKLATTHHTMR